MSQSSEDYPIRLFITGATDGLGLAIAKYYASKGSHLIIHGKDINRCHIIELELIDLGAKSVRVEIADFRNLSDICAMAKRLLESQISIDVIINNAGIGIEDAPSQTIDGLEQVFQINYVSSFMLNRILVPILIKNKGQIVNIASAGQYPLDLGDLDSYLSWSGPFAYGRSKLAMICDTVTLAEYFDKEQFPILVNAIHPASLMPTKLLPSLMEALNPLETGVSSVVNLIELTKKNDNTGKFFYMKELGTLHDQPLSKKFRSELCSRTEQIIYDFLH